MAKKRVPKPKVPTIPQAIAETTRLLEAGREAMEPAADRETHPTAFDKEWDRMVDRRKQLWARRSQRRAAPSWEVTLTEEVKLPMEFLAALGAGRSMLLKPFNRQLSLEESVAVAGGFRVLIDTIDRMKREILDYAERLEACESEAELAREQMNGLLQRFHQIKRHCSIPNVPDNDEE